MCCALNSEVTFKDTLFGSLVTEAQGEETETRKVKASSGLRAGVSLVLDMHSNRASFGTIADTSSAFSVFIGSPTEFPVLKEDKIAIEPGKEHFLKLSGQVSRMFKDGELKSFHPGGFNIWHPAPRPKLPPMLLQGRGRPGVVLRLHLHQLQVPYTFPRYEGLLFMLKQRTLL